MILIHENASRKKSISLCCHKLSEHIQFYIKVAVFRKGKAIVFLSKVITPLSEVSLIKIDREREALRLAALKVLDS